MTSERILRAMVAYFFGVSGGFALSVATTVLVAPGIASQPTGELLFQWLWWLAGLAATVAILFFSAVMYFSPRKEKEQ